MGGVTAEGPAVTKIIIRVKSNEKDCKALITPISNSSTLSTRTIYYIQVYNNLKPESSRSRKEYAITLIDNKSNIEVKRPSHTLKLKQL